MVIATTILCMSEMMMATGFLGMNDVPTLTVKFH